MNFPEYWIKMIMECVTTPTYRVVINGDLIEPIKPSSRLRQGDPLSPYLFILYVNVLSGLLIEDLAINQIKGIKICRDTPLQ